MEVFLSMPYHIITMARTKHKRATVKKSAPKKTKKSAPKKVSAWTKYLKKYGGKGYTRAQLSAGYKAGKSPTSFTSGGRTKAPAKSQVSKARPKVKKVVTRKKYITCAKYDASDCASKPECAWDREGKVCRLDKRTGLGKAVYGPRKIPGPPPQCSTLKRYKDCKQYGCEWDVDKMKCT
jgi:hypothetical protein